MNLFNTTIILTPEIFTLNENIGAKGAGGDGS